MAKNNLYQYFNENAHIEILANSGRKKIRILL